MKHKVTASNSPPMPILNSLYLSTKNSYMKSLFTILALLFISLFSKAQLSEGNWLLGGSGSFYSYNQTYTSASNNTTAKYTNIDLSASIGYFVIDKLVVGIIPSYSYYKGEVASQGVVSGTVARPSKFYIGPFARYYFLNANKQFNILADIRYQFGINKIPFPPKEQGTLSNFSFMAGPEIFFNSSVGMEILLGYKITKETIDSQTGYQDKRNGFQVSIGFQIHLEKK